MRIFYVRPAREGGYGAGDGSSYENAWSGFKSIDWDAVASAEPATVWVCGSPERPSGFMTVHVELSYLQQQASSSSATGANDLELEARPHPRRESPVAV